VLVRTGKFAAGPEAAVTALAAAGGSVPVIDSIADLPGLIESLGEAGPGG
jgi:hypothetical protein